VRERPVPERPPTYCVFAIYYFVIGDKSYNFYNFLANYYYDFSDLGNFVSRELLAGAWT
jgi:hypothetical protein